MKPIKNPSRRELLTTMGILPVLGMSSSALSKGNSQEKIDALTGPTFITRSDQQDYAKFKVADFCSGHFLLFGENFRVVQIHGL